MLKKPDCLVAIGAAICVPVGIIFEQLVVAATPAAFVLSLNLISRRSVEDQFRQTSETQQYQIKQLDEKVNILNFHLAGQTKEPGNIRQEGLEKLEVIFDRFHTLFTKLCTQHHGSQKLKINGWDPLTTNEYDVHYALHALLSIYFDDIKPEEQTPSYAGSHARVDFFLRNEQIFIEVKKTRDNRRDTQVANELIQDIHRYKTHPGCKILVCFVYDPGRYIQNPTQLENDLSNDDDNIPVMVFIRSS